MDEEGVRRWLDRHPAGARILAGFDLSDAALLQVIAQVREEHPDATVADIRRHILRLKEGR